ncbi:hypothetical protein Hhaem_02230 [Haemophilus haemolyticus]|nr:hypothetical protein Hhaem_02230 [Haemophilus haemolyticus]
MKFIVNEAEAAAAKAKEAEAAAAKAKEAEAAAAKAKEAEAAAAKAKEAEAAAAKEAEAAAAKAKEAEAAAAKEAEAAAAKAKEAEAAAKEPEAPKSAASSDYEKTSKLDDGKTEWRTLNIKHAQVQNSLSSTFDNSSKSFNLNELSNNQLGKHNGTTDAAGYVLAGKNVKPLEGKLKYNFVNQPYSSYGVVYSSEERNGNHDFEKLFYLAVDGKSSDLVKATYKGKVFAKVKVGESEDKSKALPTIDEDGDVTLNVQKNSSDKFEMSGTIDSKTVGSISLYRKEIKENKVNSGHVDFAGDEAEGIYSATISKNGSDIVGRVTYTTNAVAETSEHPTVLKDGERKYLFHYDAVFGATK